MVALVPGLAVRAFADVVWPSTGRKHTRAYLLWDMCPPNLSGLGGHLAQNEIRIKDNMNQKVEIIPRPCQICFKLTYEVDQICNGCQKDLHIEQKQKTRFAQQTTRLWALQLAHYRCTYCGKDIDEKTCNIDHVMPFRESQETKRHNLVAVCVDCNQAKGNLYTQWFLDLLGILSKDHHEAAEFKKKLETLTQKVDASKAIHIQNIIRDVINFLHRINNNNREPVPAQHLATKTSQKKHLSLSDMKMWEVILANTCSNCALLLKPNNENDLCPRCEAQRKKFGSPR